MSGRKPKYFGNVRQSGHNGTLVFNEVSTGRVLGVLVKAEEPRRWRLNLSLVPAYFDKDGNVHPGKPTKEMLAAGCTMSKVYLDSKRPIAIAEALEALMKMTK